MKLGTQVELGKIETMADNGNKIVLYTPELAVEARTTLFEFAKEKTAYMVLAHGAVDDIEVPETLTDTVGTKTPSQRLRNSLYRYWESVGKPMSGFPVFYETEMEKLIDQAKAKIDG